MKKKVFLTVSTLLFSLITLSSCSSLGPVFTEVKDVPKDKALVYFYRPSACIGSGSDLHVYHIGFEGRKFKTIIRLPNGSYYPYITSPGRNTFDSESGLFGTIGNPLEINLEPGEVYYISVLQFLEPERIQFTVVRKKEANKVIKSLN